MFKNKMIYFFIIFVATKNGRTKKFSSSSFGAVFAFWDRDGWIKIRNRDKHTGSATLIKLFLTQDLWWPGGGGGHGQQAGAVIFI
jgi:hypothetical protein